MNEMAHLLPPVIDGGVELHCSVCSLVIRLIRPRVSATISLRWAATSPSEYSDRRAERVVLGLNIQGRPPPIPLGAHPSEPLRNYLRAT